LEQSQARAILLTKGFRANPFLEHLRSVRHRLPHLQRTIVIPGDTSNTADCLSLRDLLLAGGHSRTPLPQVHGDEPCTVIYTSGTTGRPKGAVLCHEAMMANGRAVFERLEIGTDDVVTTIVPMFHSASFCTVIPGCLATGASYVGIDAFDPVEMMSIIERRGATVHVGVPATFWAMLHHPRRGEFDLSTLRVGTCGGADSDPELLAECAAAFPMPGLVQVYGLTEASALVTCPAPTDDARFRTAGPPLQDYELRIVSIEDGKTLPVGEVGEIQVATKHVMVEYLGMPEATAEAFTADGWLRTGDVGSLTATGELVLAGARLKDIIIRGGENIYPAEIEAVLTRHPQVDQAAVFGIPDERLGEVVAAALVCDPALTTEALRSFCADRLARFKLPAAVYRVAAFPVTPSGKVRKVELGERARAGELRDLAEGRS
jgi:fatty-acyl-CoA synthase